MIQVKGEAYVLCVWHFFHLCWSQEQVVLKVRNILRLSPWLILGQTTGVRSDQIRYRVRFLWTKGDPRLFSSQLTSASWQYLDCPQLLDALDAATQLRWCQWTHKKREAASWDVTFAIGGEQVKDRGNATRMITTDFQSGFSDFRDDKWGQMARRKKIDEHMTEWKSWAKNWARPA